MKIPRNHCDGLPIPFNEVLSCIKSTDETRYIVIKCAKARTKVIDEFRGMSALEIRVKFRKNSTNSESNRDAKEN